MLRLMSDGRNICPAIRWYEPHDECDPIPPAFGGSPVKSRWCVPNHPNKISIFTRTAVMCAKPILLKNSERRRIPSANCCPKTLSTGREGCFDHSAGGLCCIAVASELGKDLIGDFRLINGGPTNMQSAIPNRALLVAQSNTQYPEAGAR